MPQARGRASPHHPQGAGVRGDQALRELEDASASEEDLNSFAQWNSVFRRRRGGVGPSGEDGRLRARRRCEKWDAPPAYGAAGRPLLHCRAFDSVKRAVVRTLAGWHGLRALDGPGEDERQRVDVAVGQHRIAEVRPAVAHQVGALQQVRRVAEA